MAKEEKEKKLSWTNPTCSGYYKITKKIFILDYPWISVSEGLGDTQKVYTSIHQGSTCIQHSCSSRDYKQCQKMVKPPDFTCEIQLCKHFFSWRTQKPKNNVLMYFYYILLIFSSSLFVCISHLDICLSHKIFQGIHAEWLFNTSIHTH
jgi:hypothetical protein